jgi:hypothetical protein
MWIMMKFRYIDSIGKNQQKYVAEESKKVKIFDSRLQNSSHQVNNEYLNSSWKNLIERKFDTIDFQQIFFGCTLETTRKRSMPWLPVTNFQPRSRRALLLTYFHFFPMTIYFHFHIFLNKQSYKIWLRNFRRFVEK